MTNSHGLLPLSRVVLGAGALAALLAGLWLWQRADARSPAPSGREAREASEPTAQRELPEAHLLASRRSEPPRAQEVAPDGVPIISARNDSSAEGPRHPHPITPEHLRIFRENSVLGELNGAMDVSDHEALRRLNTAYAREYPEDPHGLQPGYALIADCLEQRTPETRARAQRYFDEERASTLRRYVRRHCLE